MSLTNWVVFSGPSGTGTVIFIMVIMAAALLIGALHDIWKKKKRK